MAVNNSLAPTSGKKVAFSAAVASETFQKIINNSIQDKKTRDKFVADITSYVANNKMLQECDNLSILAAAMQGNALNLSPALQEYYVVPYKTKDGYKAQFQLGTQGRIQLALRTHDYTDITAKEIREGEYKGRDPKNARPIIEYIADDIEREDKPIIGYYASIELHDGFFKSEYFSKEKALRWAARYSKAFDRELYDRFAAGEKLSWEEQKACSSPWYQHTDAMGAGVVLRQVLKWGPRSTEINHISKLYENDDEETNIIADFGIQPVQVETTAEEEAPAEPEKAETKKTAKAKKAEPKPVEDDDLDDFFGDNPFAEAENQ